MNPFVLLAPTVLVAFAVVYAVFRALGRVWVEHKVKLALLAKLETHPELIRSFDELEGLVASVSGGGALPRQNFRLTGALLALIGVGCVVWGRGFSLGRLSVGLYFGGLVCVCLGFVLGLFGLLMRNVGRHDGTARDSR